MRALVTAHPAPAFSAEAALLTRAVKLGHRGSGEVRNRMVRALKLPGYDGGGQKEAPSLSAARQREEGREAGVEASKAHCANRESKGLPVGTKDTPKKGDFRKLFKDCSFQLH